MNSFTRTVPPRGNSLPRRGHFHHFTLMRIKCSRSRGDDLAASLSRTRAAPRLFLPLLPTRSIRRHHLGRRPIPAAPVSSGSAQHTHDCSSMSSTTFTAPIYFSSPPVVAPSISPARVSVVEVDLASGDRLLVAPVISAPVKVAPRSCS
ncbi:hypothetical protein VPH35_113381 [Triticum aestivum]